jgi:hypothetical protein
MLAAFRMTGQETMKTPFRPKANAHSTGLKRQIWMN